MSWEYGYIKLYKSNTFHENAMGIWLQNSFILPFAQKFQAPRHHSTDRGRIVESTQISPWLTHLLYGYIWVNYNDLTVTSLESWFIREIIPKWPNYSGWWNILIYPDIWISQQEQRDVEFSISKLKHLLALSQFLFHFSLGSNDHIRNDGYIGYLPNFLPQFCSGNVTSISELLPFSSLFSGVLLLDYVYCWLMFVTSILSLSLCIYVCISVYVYNIVYIQIMYH